MVDFIDWIRKQNSTSKLMIVVIAGFLAVMIFQTIPTPNTFKTQVYDNATNTTSIQQKIIIPPNSLVPKTIVTPEYFVVLFVMFVLLLITLYQSKEIKEMLTDLEAIEILDKNLKHRRDILKQKFLQNANWHIYGVRTPHRATGFDVEFKPKLYYFNIRLTRYNKISEDWLGSVDMYNGMVFDLMKLDSGPISSLDMCPSCSKYGWLTNHRQLKSEDLLFMENKRKQDKK